MPEVRVGVRHVNLASGTNLLSGLLAAGINVPHSCRAGSCHACMVRCLSGELVDAQPDALSAAQRQQGWRLACQCQVLGDLTVQVFDPAADGINATLTQSTWLSATVLRLRLLPALPLLPAARRMGSMSTPVTWIENTGRRSSVILI